MALILFPHHITHFLPQMVSDEFRGWAWSRALLGLRAAEIHVCGDPSAVPLLRAIAEATGDSFATQEYSRFAPLVVDRVRCMEGLLLHAGCQ